MHAGTAHLLQRRALPDDHLDHAWRAEVHRSVSLDHEDDVAERGDVRAAGRRRAEEAADLRHATGEAVLVVEDAARAAPAREQLDLVGEPRAGRVDQPEDGRLVLERVLRETDDLLDGPRTPRAGLHRRVVGHHADPPTVDRADAGDDAVGREIVGERVGEEAALDERALVEEQGETVADEELALALELRAFLLEIALAGPLGRGVQLLGHWFSLTGPRSRLRAARRPGS